MRSPWAWVPSVYGAQGLPYAVAMLLSVVMFKRLGLDNTDIALYTSWLHLPWVIKPVWAPLVERLGRLRRWVWAMQLVLGACLGLLPVTLALPDFVAATLLVLWLVAFAAATHDVAADGLYIQALDGRQQAQFVGVRSACWRLSMLVGQGGLVWLAGTLEAFQWTPRQAWGFVFGAVALCFVLLGLLHAASLPATPEAPGRSDPASAGVRGAMAAWWAAVRSFFARPDIGVVLAFLLVYRFGEAQLLKLVVPFLLDDPASGGLGLDTRAVGVLYGGVGVACLLAGGVAGGLAIARWGLVRCLWPMVAVMHLPNLLFVALAAWQPAALWVIGGVLALEQLGYGFGFTAYTVYMLRVAAGHQGASAWTASHYALCTGFMALGLMVPGLWSGALQQHIGYLAFFAWACVASLPSVAVVWLCLRRQPWLAATGPEPARAA
ncbi:MAG: MFS transporter [Rubrivivax sp.]|jgi:PAT family beta-lactamase induction signal transducer AmpG|nr:MFS transporter [Rubrivivax sp.]